ncbi:MAG: hypothetical protein HY303_08550 [Candidatus Wallbacteria bacterium]|nr:hypothetical protein [Candidatus Wallbacteria bacterium]
MNRSLLAVVTVLALAAAGAFPLAASVDSLTVSTSTWKRSEASVVFQEGAVGLTVAFDKAPAPKSAKAGDDAGFDYEEQGPRITVEVTYRPAGATAARGPNVAGLDGTVDSSSLADEDVVGQPIGDVSPDAPLPKQKVLTARAGAAEYRVTGAAVPADLVPFLKALLAADPILYRARRQYPGEIELVGPKPALKLFEAPKTPDFFKTPRPGETPDVEYTPDGKQALSLLFKMRHDELVFRKSELSVSTAAARQSVRVYLRCGSIAIYADTGADGVATFDLGAVADAGEWRYQAGVGNPVAADWVLPSAGRVLFRPAAAKKTATSGGAPASDSPADVAAALAALVAARAPSASELPPELTCALFAQPTDRKSSWTWKAEGYWLDRARAGRSGASDTQGWLDAEQQKAEEAWIDAKASATPPAPKAGWTSGQAEQLLAALRRYERDRGAERLAAARKAGAALFASVLAASDPVADGSGPSGAISGHALAALAFFKANELFRESGYRRMAIDQVQHLMAEHVDSSDGALRLKKGGEALSDLRAYALVAQAVSRAWRSSSKKPLKAALAALRKRVSKSWSAGRGYALGSSKPELASQFWALSVFADVLFPYFELRRPDWLS